MKFKLMMRQRGESKVYILALFFLTIIIAASIIVIANNHSAINSSSTLPDLAPTINGKSIENPEIKGYLDSNGYFRSLNYESLSPGHKEYILSVGNKKNNIKGFQVGNEKYVLHLVFCHWGTQTCVLKVNGVNIPALNSYDPNVTDSISTFEINSIYELKLNSISFDQCDNLRFCNLHFDGYDSANISVKTKLHP